MKHNLMALKGLVTWTKKYSYGSHWEGYLNIDPDFTVRLEQFQNEWNLVIEKGYDYYYVEYPRTKRDAAYMINDWIDRGMQMEDY